MEEKCHYHLNHSKADSSPASSKAFHRFTFETIFPENLELERAQEIPVRGTDTASLTLIQTLIQSDEAFVTDLRSSCWTAQAQA